MPSNQIPPPGPSPDSDINVQLRDGSSPRVAFAVLGVLVGLLLVVGFWMMQPAILAMGAGGVAGLVVAYCLTRGAC